MMRKAAQVTTATIFLLGMAMAMSSQEPKPKPLFHTFKLSQTEVGVNCVNGGVPQVKQLGSLIIVSCAK